MRAVCSTSIPHPPSPVPHPLDPWPAAPIPTDARSQPFRFLGSRGQEVVRRSWSFCLDGPQYPLGLVVGPVLCRPNTRLRHETAAARLFDSPGKPNCRFCCPGWEEPSRHCDTSQACRHDVDLSLVAGLGALSWSPQGSPAHRQKEVQKCGQQTPLLLGSMGHSGRAVEASRKSRADLG